MPRYRLDPDTPPELVKGRFKLVKSWQTDKADYEQIINEYGTELVIATDKKTGSKHLLQTVLKEWDHE